MLQNEEQSSDFGNLLFYRVVVEEKRRDREKEKTKLWDSEVI